MSPFGDISRHRDTQRRCRAVDRSYRISGMQQPVSSLEDLETTCWDTQECTFRAIDRSEALLSPFGGISRHRDAQRRCRAVDRSYCISGVQHPVLSLSNLRKTWLDTHESTSGAVDRSGGVLSCDLPFRKPRGDVEWLTTCIVPYVCRS